MSDMGQTPEPDSNVSATTQQNGFPTGLGPDKGPAGPVATARLQAIHDLIRSGDYHVPANAIADRMIEQMLADRRRRGI